MNRIAVVVLVALALPAAAKPPKLTLFISIDSFGSDTLARARPKLKGGLAKMIAEGAYFPTVRYEAAECVTAPGHATLSTGANPWRHGIVSNKIVNRQTGKLEPAFIDPGHPVLEAPLGPDDTSPLNLLAETLSDKLRQTTWQRGKAIAIGGKARGTIPLAGRLGEAWWFSEPVGRFVTGTWYRKEFPAWVKAFNDKKLPDAYHAKRWELLAPPKEYLGEDDRPFESDWYAMGRAFPHPLGGGLPAPGKESYSALASSPMMNDLTVEFAKAAIDGEQLGKDEVPDLLSVSFSAVDRVYHLYGPASWETQDTLLRVDKAVGELIAAAERAAGGRANLVVVLTGDHGGAAIPEEYAAMGLDGVRVDPRVLQKGLADELQARFKVANAVQGIEETDVYLDQKALTDKKVELAAVRRAAAAWLLKQPDIAAAASRDELDGPDQLGLLRMLKVGHYLDRSGDVLMVTRPYHVLETEPKGTSHGSPWAYDAEVPLLLLGRGVRPGVYPVVGRAVDVASTTAALREMGNPAMAEGRPLVEALALPR